MLLLYLCCIVFGPFYLFYQATLPDDQRRGSDETALAMVGTIAWIVIPLRVAGCLSSDLTSWGKLFPKCWFKTRFKMLKAAPCCLYFIELINETTPQIITIIFVPRLNARCSVSAGRSVKQTIWTLVWFWLRRVWNLQIWRALITPPHWAYFFLFLVWRQLSDFKNETYILTHH